MQALYVCCGSSTVLIAFSEACWSFISLSGTDAVPINHLLPNIQSVLSRSYYFDNWDNP